MFLLDRDTATEPNDPEFVVISTIFRTKFLVKKQKFIFISRPIFPHLKLTTVYSKICSSI